MSPDLAPSEPRPKSEESPGLATDPGGLELSVVMPCLNERDTLETCIRKAQRTMAIAGAFGARVVNVSERGYGNALRAGIAASRGTYVLMGDADDSYDFSELAP